MYKTVMVTKRYTFEASHNLINYEGKCANLHGHSYKLEVSLKRDDNRFDATTGMLVDFNDIDTIVKPIVDRYDHAYLNDFFHNPTAEFMATQIFNEIEYALIELGKTINSPYKGVHVAEIKLWETEKCFVTVKGHDNSDFYTTLKSAT